MSAKSIQIPALDSFDLDNKKKDSIWSSKSIWNSAVTTASENVDQYKASNFVWSPMQSNDENIGSIWQVKNKSSLSNKIINNDFEAPISSPYSFEDSFKLIRPSDIGEILHKPNENLKYDGHNEIFQRPLKTYLNKTSKGGEFSNSHKTDQINANMFPSFKPTVKGFSNNSNSHQSFNISQNLNNNNQLFSEEFLNYLSMIN